MLTEALQQRADDAVICRGPSGPVTVGQLLHRAAAYQQQLTQQPVRRCALYSDDSATFLAALIACEASGIDVLVPPHDAEKLASSLEVDLHLGDGRLATAPAATSARLDRDRLSDIQLTFATSGSTGQARGVTKRLSQLLEEARHIDAQWPTMRDDALVASTVCNQHMYGMTFRLLWPLISHRVLWQQALAGHRAMVDLAADHEALVWVTSPAVLTRLDDSLPRSEAEATVLSSGGFLSVESALAAEQILGARLMQIYGSTETGVIAHKPAAAEIWTAFPAIRIRVVDSLLEVCSPFCQDAHWQQTGDRVTQQDDGLILHGRVDQIVKVEEKRVSLQEIEAALGKDPLIEACQVLSFQQPRQHLAAAVVLTAEGRAMLEARGRREMTVRWQRRLAGQFDPVVIPKRFRYLQQWPLNPMGKRCLSDLEALFK